MVEINPTADRFSLGSSFAFDLVGHDFAALVGGSIDLHYNSSQVQIDRVEVAPHFDFLRDGGASGSGSSWRGIAFDIFANSPAAGSFTMASLRLTATAAGSSEFSILSLSTFSGGSDVLSPTLQSASIEVKSNEEASLVVRFAAPNQSAKVGNTIDV